MSETVVPADAVPAPVTPPPGAATEAAGFPRPVRLLCVVCGPFFPKAQATHGDFATLVAAGLRQAGVPPDAVALTAIDIRAGDVLPPATDGAFDAVVFSGSVPDVDDSPFVLKACDWIRAHVLAARDAPHGMPMLGLCYGHQLLAAALPGGAVGDLAEGEFGTVDATPTEAANDDPLWRRVVAGIEGGDGPAAAPADDAAAVAVASPTTPVHCCHNQTVTRLPHGATSLLRSEKEPHHLVRFAPLTYGTQFHPEFTHEFLTAAAAEFPPSFDDDARRRFVASLRPTPLAQRVLRAFVELVADRVTATKA